jgi:hypothetical protein
MAKPLRSQLNQIRAWVQQGRTDAWIAHQLEVSTSELREFRRRHELDATEDSGEVDLRDEIEAEIEAATREEELAAEAEAEDEEEAEYARSDPDESVYAGSDPDADSAEESTDGSEGSDPSATGDRPRRRRRRRRGGRGRRTGTGMQASFDHGEEGYGLWLDPAIADDPVYTEHWADHRQVEVTVEPDRIVIRRTGDSGDDDGD